MTMKKLAQTALDVQDASNLSGVIHSWVEVISALRGLLPNASIDEINRHPVNQLFASKVIEMTCMGFAAQDRYGDAYFECCSLVEQYR